MIYDTIKAVAANQGVSIYRIEKDLEFPNGLISKWNKSTPSASNLAKVAKYLGVTTEKLLGDGQKGGRMKETINEFLKFRSQFTKREWFEINQVFEARLNEKADQLKLDDSDLEIISKRLEKVIQKRFE